MFTPDNPAGAMDIVRLAYRYYQAGFEGEEVTTEEGELDPEDATHAALVNALDSCLDSPADIFAPGTLPALALNWRRAELIQQQDDPALANSPAWEAANVAYNQFIDSVEAAITAAQKTI